MTIGRVGEKTVERKVPVYDWPVKGKDAIILKRYGVVLRNSDGVMVLGHVITPLEINDWCELHHYKLMSVHDKGDAFPGQKTDLY